MAKADPAADAIRAWRADPALFVRQVIGVEPDLWQLDALAGFRTHQRIAMQACKGPGKTALLAWVLLWFLATRKAPKIAATSISGDNLADGLWTELAKWISQSPFLKSSVTWGKTRVFRNDAPELAFISARTWSKSASREQQADTLAGLHADELLFVADEAGSMPDAVIAAAEAGLANANGADRVAFLVIAGNPTMLEGPLYRAATRERHLWHRVEITGDPDDPKRSPRVAVQWAREQIDKYGRDNPFVLVNVFGKFPPASLRALLGVSEVEEAMRRTVQPGALVGLPVILGVDVALEGGDASVIIRRQGPQAWAPAVFRNVTPSFGAGEVAMASQQLGADAIFIDNTGGFGSGWVDNLKQMGHSCSPVHFAGEPHDRRYANKRAEMWFLMAQWVKDGGCLPNVPDLVSELTAPEYSFAKDRVLIEPKDDVRAKIGRSPDIADALALTFASPVAAKSQWTLLGLPDPTSGRVHRNPFDLGQRGRRR